MKVLTEGHKYELMSFDPPTKEGDIQTLQFIQKESVSATPTVLSTVNNGTTTEEVLKVLIDRTNYLQNKFPCRENALAITKMEEALFWFNERTRKRQEQNVEGKELKHQ